MQNIYFDLYVKDILKLSRTMVIKYSNIAKQINKELELEGCVINRNDPTTWKYYLNLNGQHHQLDKKMYVRSSDTLEMIEFNKANLKLHLATLREFYPGSFQYTNLVRQFPEQELLIRGIIFPVDMDKAINARDGEIIFYDNTLIEGNEDDIVSKIQAWIDVFTFRWYNEKYDIVDEFNLNAFLGNLYAKLPLAINNIRLRNAHTNKAHSYFVKEYLASNGRLDRYYDYLDLRQRLWLYRNIRFIKRNVGKEEIFKRLVDNILTPKGIPIVNYNILHDSKDLIQNKRHDIKLLKKDINFDTVSDENKYESIRQVILREESLARDNWKVQDITEAELIEDASSDKYSVLPTKVLDSEVMDRSLSSVKKLSTVLLNQWIYLASKDNYRAYVTITNPRTGEFMIMSVKDAFILMIYSYAKAYEVDLEYIPDIHCYEVLRNPLPNFYELRSIAPDYFSDELIVGYQKLFNPMNIYISTEQFYLDASRTHKNYLRQWEAYSYQQTSRGRSYAEQIIKRHYMNIKCKLVEGKVNFLDYFRDNAIDIKNLTRLEFAQIAIDCYTHATGSNLFKEITLSEIQKELLNLMGDLSSYPLQYLRDITYSDFHILGISASRLGDIETKAGSLYRGNFSDVKFRAMGTKAEHDINLYDSIITPNIDYDYDIEETVKIDPNVDIKDLSLSEVSYDINLGHSGVLKAAIVVHKKDNDNNFDFYED